MSLSKKEKRTKQEEKRKKELEWRLFRAFCAFFNFELADIYCLFHCYVDINEYYTFESFKTLIINRPTSIMNKLELRGIVLNYISEFSENVWKISNDKEQYPVIGLKWEEELRKYRKELGFDG